MKRLLQIIAVVALLFIAGPLSSAMAQGTVFTYQGRVTDHGTNFSGLGQFKFALVTVATPPPNITYTTFWSNDGTSVNGSEPTAAVIVSVSNGLFTVVLGDTNRPNMASIATSLFNQPNLQLRIWFNDGVSGSVALDPAQSVTPAPYAVFANMASKLVNGFSIQQNLYGAPNIINGSSLNYVPNGVVGATIAGGGAVNYNASSSSNVVSSDFGTVSGGGGNTASTYAVVGGGYENTANGYTDTVGGGYENLTTASFSTVSGGLANEATNVYATVPGGNENTAGGLASFAAGNGAEALHNGSFVWNDYSDASGFKSTADNQFSVKAMGGVRLVTGTNGVKLGSSGQYFAPGGSENLRMLRGVVDGAGNILHGTGFAITRTGVGAYTVTFSSAFADVPAVTVSAQSGLVRIATTTNVALGSMQIRTFDNTGAAVDAQFHFIAMGLQ